MLDTCVVIDLIEVGSPNHDWSRQIVQQSLDGDGVSLSAIVIGELSARPMTRDAIADVVSRLHAEVAYLDRESARLAGQAHARYRAAGGTREKLLGDFLIGGHAATAGAALITRDPSRYRTYFPELTLITPETQP